jgi:hypothetical protein
MVNTSLQENIENKIKEKSISIIMSIETIYAHLWQYFFFYNYFYRTTNYSHVLFLFIRYLSNGWVKIWCSKYSENKLSVSISILNKLNLLWFYTVIFSFWLPLAGVSQHMWGATILIWWIRVPSIIAHIPYSLCD